MRHESRRLVVNGLRVAVEEYRPEHTKGIVLLLHGFGQTKYSWRSAARSIADAGWDAIALDARGHGDSEWATDGDYSNDALVSDLVEVAAGYDDPVLIGASMGGLTALLAVGEGRVRSRGLVLVDVAPEIERDGVHRIQQHLSAGKDGFASLADVEAAVSAMNPTRQRAATEVGLRSAVRRRDDGRWYWHWDPAFVDLGSEEFGRRRDSPRTQAACRRITLPVLLVRGANSDVLSASGVQQFLNLVPHAKFSRVDGAGHTVAGDNNEVFKGAVVDFLNGL